ncbi:MAG TPA: anthranilate phosphoribosyltransferase [Ferrovibrio sp.]|uniref:anthranilate phosphoribosyltransferase n=1 Tax=Ferrovibrio sp. TaxID=1917215 RepID=UPI002B4B3A49|nr:anthranilate phosphoribosyltransferase [Ferrovibrio sp.]HLT78978.1 anthranilate phosphoribosyltransferase [Ferrovibrio sp.]
MSADVTEFKRLLALVADGARLSVEDARTAFDVMMSGNATPAQMGGFLMALRVRGETVDEITGGAMTLRAKVHGVTAPPNAIDIVGTGGDVKGTWNVSTCSAFVLAGCGVPVAKHGNRAVSSKTGAADVLTALGVNIDCDFRLIEKAIAEAGVGFLMAPRHHSAMRHVGPTRVELGTRTIFNLLGPLSNPAGVKRQLLGVFDRRWVQPLAEVMGKLGSEKVWVVHGSDGLDEITTTGPTYVSETAGGKLRHFEITPEEAGLPRAKLEDLKGDEPTANAVALRAVLSGAPGAFRDIVLLNTAACLVIADRAPDLRAGAQMAAEAIDSGKARAALARLIEITHEPPPPDPEAEQKSEKK